VANSIFNIETNTVKKFKGNIKIANYLNIGEFTL